MRKPIKLDLPDQTAEELARSLGVSAKRQREIRAIVARAKAAYASQQTGERDTRPAGAATLKSAAA